MTRFTITMHQATDLIINSIGKAHGGEVFVPKLKAYKLDTLKDAIFDILKKSVGVDKIKVRVGEKFHESLINIEEIRNTYETDDGLYIVLDKEMHKETFEKWNNLKETKLKNEYSSNNVDVLTKDEIITILNQEIFNK